MPKGCRLMEIARNSLSGCKRWRSSELGWPRLRVVVGQRPKSECHPVREPENARLLPGVKRIFHHLPMFDRICAIPPAYHVLVEENIYLPISLSNYLPTQLYQPTYLPIYLSIYLSLAFREIDCFRPWTRPSLTTWHCPGSKPFQWSPKALAWKARPSMTSFGLSLAFSAAA